MSKKITTNQHNGHEFVEIGGIKWATCNVGAEKPTDFGLYFQWGDRKGYTADEVCKIKMFDLDTYKHYKGKGFTKYNKFDGKHVLDLCDDAAFAYMGQGWRMPTNDDFRCLSENATYSWTNSYCLSRVPGMVFTDRTDNTKELFLPAAGYYHRNKNRCIGTDGFYWNNSCLNTNGCYINFCYGGLGIYGICNRIFGFSVRGILID